MSSAEDEAFARQLQAEEFRQARQEPAREAAPQRTHGRVATPVPHQAPAAYAVAPGASTLVYLRHTQSQRQIGDVLKVVVVAESRVYFGNAFRIYHALGTVDLIEPCIDRTCKQAWQATVCKT